MATVFKLSSHKYTILIISSLLFPPLDCNNFRHHTLSSERKGKNHHYLSCFEKIELLIAKEFSVISFCISIMPVLYILLK